MYRLRLTLFSTRTIGWVRPGCSITIAVLQFLLPLLTPSRPRVFLRRGNTSYGRGSWSPGSTTRNADGATAARCDRAELCDEGNSSSGARWMARSGLYPVELVLPRA